MRIELRGVGKGRRSEALPPTTVGFESGRATLARAETEQRPTVLGLLASGRMAASTRSATRSTRSRRSIRSFASATATRRLATTIRRTMSPRCTRAPSK